MKQKNKNRLLLLSLIGIILVSMTVELPAQTVSNMIANPSPSLSGKVNTPFRFVQSVQLWSNLLPTTKARSTAPPLSYLIRSSSSTPNERPYAYDPSHLAFFCRLEVQLEKATKVPVRFRLGDVQQVDYLEGKFTGWRYGY